MTAANSHGVGVDWRPLETGEELVNDPSELAWRQIHPRFYQGGIIGEDAFVAREDEDRKLSTSRESKVTAQAAFEHHTNTLGLQSAGVGAVTVDEVSRFGSRVVDDEAIQTADPPTPGHCYVDFREMSKDERAALREALAEVATERGLVFAK